MHDLKGKLKGLLNKPHFKEPQHSWSLMHPQNCIFILLSASRIGGWAFVLLYPSGMHFSRSTAYLRPGSGWKPRNLSSESAWSYQIMANRQWSFWFCKIKKFHFFLQKMKWKHKNSKKKSCTTLGPLLFYCKIMCF